MAGKVAEKLRLAEIFVVERQICDSDDMAMQPIRHGTHQLCREPRAETALTMRLTRTATESVEGM